MATAGSIVIDLLMRTGSFETDSKRAEKRLKELKKEAVDAGKAIGAGVAVAATALAALTWQSIQMADQLDEMSMRLGISTETLSGWGYAAKMSGTDLESLAGAIPKLSKTLAAAADESSKAGELFKALGINVKDATGNLRDVEDVLPEIADRFKTLKNDTTEAALAQELFGRSGANMLEFLNRGSEGIQELSDRAADLGLIVSGETAAAAAEFNDKLEDLRGVASAFGLEIAKQLLPLLTALTEKFVKVASDGDTMAETGRSLGDVIKVLGGAIDFVIPYFKAIDDVIQGATIGMVGLIEAAKGVINLDWTQIARGLNVQAQGRDLAIFGRDAVNGPQQAPRRRVTFSDEQAIPGSMLGDRNLPDPTARINRLLGGTESAGKKAREQLSEAEKAAQRLQEQFDQTLASLTEQQYMLGKTGEEARLRYEIEFGALKSLDQAKKDQLINEAAYLDALTKAADEEEKRLEAADRATEAFKRVNDELLVGVKLLGMSADEQEIWNNLAWAGVDAESARGKEIIENTKRLQGVRDAMEDQIGAMDAIRDAGKDFILDLSDGVKPLDAIEDALDSIHKRILQMITENLMDKLFGKQGDPAGGSAGGWLQGILDGFFGNGSQGQTAPASSGGNGAGFWGTVASWAGSFFGGGKAGGGDVLSNRGYWVGEQGPEWFQPRTAGTVLPNGESMAMAGTRRRDVSLTQVFNNPILSDRSTDTQRQQESGRKAQRAISRNS